MTTFLQSHSTIQKIHRRKIPLSLLAFPRSVMVLFNLLLLVVVVVVVVPTASAFTMLPVNGNGSKHNLMHSVEQVPTITTTMTVMTTTTNTNTFLQASTSASVAVGDIFPYHRRRSQKEQQTKGGRTLGSQSAKPLPSSATTTTADESSATSTANVQNMELVDQLRHDAKVIFSILDADGSGSISRQEFTHHLQQAGCSNDFVETLFDKMDWNGDGVLSMTEFRTLYLTVPSLRRLPGMGQPTSMDDDDNDDGDDDALRNGAETSTDVSHHYDTLMMKADHVFDSLDTDGNGSIDRSELESYWNQKAAAAAGATAASEMVTLQHKAMERIFDLLDVNHDNCISRMEFRDAFWRYSAFRQALGESAV